MAPLTSVSVKSIMAKHSGSPSSIIAISRADGKVDMYDDIGLLLAQKIISETGEKVISLEWAAGPSPTATAVNGTAIHVVKAAPISVHQVMPEHAPTTTIRSKAMHSSRRRKVSTPHGLGLPPALRRPVVSTTAASKMSNAPTTGRKFTVHPDEVDEGTVRHTPSPHRSHAMPLPGVGHSDLFSSAKPSSKPGLRTAEKRLMSPPRSRPRLSSQTFVNHVPFQQTEAAEKARFSALLPLRESHATSTGSEIARPSVTNVGRSNSFRRASTGISPLGKRRTASKPSHARRTNIAPDENAKTSPQALNTSRLHDRLNKPDKHNKAADRRTHHHAVHSKELASPAKQKAWHPGNVLERESTWPTDSIQDESSLHNDHDHDDAWQTSETDDEAKQLRQHRLRSLQAQRPPARQTSRSRVTPNGTVSTTKTSKPLQHTLALPRTDGLTEDDMMTAQTHLSPIGILSPASDDVRRLFPRTSSQSPKRKRNPDKRSPRPQERTFTELAVNTAFGRQPKTPWARAEGLVRSPSYRCFDCAKLSSRVFILEGEMWRLRTDLMALRIRSC